jgi:peptidoglycan/LPS O-acetylase OafA/YrhL
VVAHHFWLFAPDSAWLRHLAPLGPLLEAGWLGVDLFFVLSGFVLTLNYAAVLGGRPGARATVVFYWARLSRIWPTWMVVLGAVVAGLVLERSLLARPPEPGAAALDAPAMVRQVLMVQVWDRPDYAATGPVGPGWSLSAEWLAYLLFPVAVLGLHRLRRRSPAVLAALALIAVTPFAYGCLTLGVHDWAWSWALRLAGAFLAGSLGALCVDRLRGTAAVSRAASPVATGTAALIVLSVWVAGAAGSDRDGVAVLLFPVLVGALALSDRGPARYLATPLVVLGGRISFALYLVHMAVFETSWTLISLVAAPGEGAAVGLLQGVVLVLPLPAAWLLWRCVEEPSRRWMKRVGPRSERRSSAPAVRNEALPLLVPPADALPRQETARRHAVLAAADG